MGNIESALIQLIFFLILYFLIRYTYAFTAQILKFGIPSAADLIQDKWYIKIFRDLSSWARIFILALILKAIVFQD